MTAKSRVEPSEELPAGLPAPARRSLLEAGYGRLEQLTDVSEAELARLHAVGPKALRMLRGDLEQRGLSFAAS